MDEVPDDIPAYFMVDPPDDLTGPSSGSFEAKAKSPHGMSRTGVLLIDDRAPSTGRSVEGRRPVIAVVDTAIGAHPWLGNHTDPDPFWRTPSPAGRVARTRVVVGRSAGSRRGAYGHGTFIAGIVRQLAPEARILSLPVMTEDGHARTWDVLDTLRWLLSRVRDATKPGQSKLFVDVINLSFGWYRGKEDKDFPAAEHYEVLHDLAVEGVRVVASAGNRSITEPVYPAAFALEQAAASSPPTTPLLSVGALDPDGHMAAYSNSGDWVQLLAPGTGLISTVPPAPRWTGPDPWSTREAAATRTRTTWLAASPAGAAPPSPRPGCRPELPVTCSMTRRVRGSRMSASGRPMRVPRPPWN